eukprot:TRINITY_DN108783_c0_g1_i1.p1 TRINITY_DN108783_c0_g1~~TRINITY_DN108783_c0_g1_i1.p1  ORF type:complete len:336 (+),score=54.83 TRINITY_DN108783_c0_g1_i1:34-1041(+)
MASLSSGSTPSPSNDIDDPERASIMSALELETLDVDLYRSVRLWKPAADSRAVFGGQIIGQALVAAHKTIKDDRLKVHSLHSYFVRPGDNSVPALYYVRQVRDGKSFATRQVTVQQHGKVIFEALISFHCPETTDFVFQQQIPDVPEPEQLPTRQENWQKILDTASDRMPDTMRQFVEARIKAPFPLEFRNCDPTLDGFVLRPKRKPRSPKMQVWARTTQELSDDFDVHACVAAYASDWVMITTAGLASPQMFAMAASLDHSMWFHAPFRADEWMLYDLESCRANSGRALIHGKLYRKDGTLVVSVTQEGLVRYAPPKPNEIPDDPSGRKPSAKL